MKLNIDGTNQNFSYSLKMFVEKKTKCKIDSNYFNFFAEYIEIFLKILAIM